jgi:hypothetical protein
MLTGGMPATAEFVGFRRIFPMRNAGWEKTEDDDEDDYEHDSYRKFHRVSSDVPDVESRRLRSNYFETRIEFCGGSSIVR